MNKCLIVEDEPLLLYDYTRAMTELGFQVIQASTLEDALYCLRTHHFTLLLLDLQLPDGTTFSLIDYLQIRDATAVIILITGTTLYPRGEISQISPRIDFVLRKPVNISDLSAIALRAMGP